MVALRYEPEPLISIEEYLEFEAQSELKHEYCDGRMWAMAGGTGAHNTICFNIGASLGAQLRGSSCRGFTADQRVRIPDTKLYSYPDATVVCGEAKFEDSAETTLLNPTVLVEVLSLSTESRDRGLKWARYQKLDSLRDYLLVEQNSAHIDHYARQADGSWRMLPLDGLDAEVQLSGAPATLPLSEVYEHISFENFH
jgi:Uma2 family endonuclease